VINKQGDNKSDVSGDKEFPGLEHCEMQTVIHLLPQQQKVSRRFCDNLRAEQPSAFCSKHVEVHPQPQLCDKPDANNESAATSVVYGDNCGDKALTWGLPPMAQTPPTRTA
jgi:hypothetical protein